MFYIVEEEKSLQRLENLAKLGLYIDVITSNDLYHPKLTSTIAVYLRPISSDYGYIIPIDHSEGLNVDKNRVEQILKCAPLLYTLDKKNLLYHFNLQGAIDLSLLFSMVKFERLEYSKDNSAINHFYNKFNQFKFVNQLIPISKLYEVCQKVFEQVKHTIELKVPEHFDFYNKTATNVFFLLEQTGLGIYYEPFVKMFNPRDPRYNILDNKVYTSYNLYNITSRPTNAFNSVNFAAIPKTSEHRKCFKPTNDCFVEFDFDGYHLRLLAEQINYTLTQESAHKQLAKLYFEKNEITEEEYREAKQINFHAIYGKIPEKWAFLEIFHKIDGFIQELWGRFENDGKIVAPISGKVFDRGLKDMHPQKLMNYLMQSLETSRNILILKELLRFLSDKKTKISLYTYDAILFDFCKEDGKEVLETIKNILESGGNYPVKFKYSDSLVL